MLSVRFEKPFSVSVEEREIPEIKENEVLLKILCVGVCGTDAQVYVGKNKFMQFPIVPFHEGVGEIVKIGSQVEEFEVGNRVVVEPILYCGKCRPCLIGRYNACDNFACLGVQVDGLGSEYFAIEPKHLHKISKELSFEKAVLIEPLAVGVHAAKRTQVKDANVLVVGAGTIGNFTAQSAKMLGAKKVVITDIEDFKLSIAKECNIDACVNTANTNLINVIKDHFDRWGADVIIDCAGTKDAFLDILNSAGKATTIVIVGNHKIPVELDLTKIQRNEIDVKGNITYTSEDFYQAIDWLVSGKVVTEGFITAVYDIEETGKAMDNIVNPSQKNMKTMIVF